MNQVIPNNNLKTQIAPTKFKLGGLHSIRRKRKKRRGEEGEAGGERKGGGEEELSFK